MNAATARGLVEAALDTITALTVTPGVLDLSVPSKSLPAACAVFDGFDERRTSSGGSADVTARFRVPLTFSVAPITTLRDGLEAIVPAVYTAFADGLADCGTVTVQDGGEPEMLENNGAIVAARKVLFVLVEYEES